MYKLQNKVSKHQSQVTDEGYEKIVARGWKGRYKVIEYVPDDNTGKPKKLEKSFTPPELSLKGKTAMALAPAKTTGKGGKK